MTSINGLTSLGSGDQAIHVVDYLGDVLGSGTYSGLDATRIQQVVANLNNANGFNNFPLVDPVIVGNVTGTGSLNGLDATRLKQFIANVPTPSIPAYPGPPTNTATGPDPLLFIPRNLTAQAGGLVTVPVELLQTNASAITLESFDLVLKFDPSKFQVDQILLGDLPAGFQVTTNVDAVHGFIYVSASTVQGLTLAPGTLGDLLEVEFRILAGAKPGQSGIDIYANRGNSTTSLNGGLLTLVPAPTNSDNNAIDGVVTIGGPPSLTPSLSRGAGTSATRLQAYDLAIGSLASDPEAGTALDSTALSTSASPANGSRRTIVASRPNQSTAVDGLIAFGQRRIKSFRVPTDEVK